MDTCLAKDNIIIHIPDVVFTVLVFFRSVSIIRYYYKFLYLFLPLYICYFNIVKRPDPSMP